MASTSSHPSIHPFIPAILYILGIHIERRSLSEYRLAYMSVGLVSIIKPLRRPWSVILSASRRMTKMVHLSNPAHNIAIRSRCFIHGSGRNYGYMVWSKPQEAEQSDCNCKVSPSVERSLVLRRRKLLVRYRCASLICCRKQTWRDWYPQCSSGYALIIDSAVSLLHPTHPHGICTSRTQLNKPDSDRIQLMVLYNNAQVEVSMRRGTKGRLKHRPRQWKKG